MATLNIEGQNVQVDDSFLSLSHEDQQKTVDDIASSLKGSGGGGSLMGAAKQLGYGLAQGAAGLAGLPGDIAHLYAKDRNSPNPVGSSALTQKLVGEVPAPQGTLESVANRVGQFAPAMIGGPEGIASKFLTRAVAPAVGSEIGGQVGGPIGEVAGALTGAAGATAAANRFRAMAKSAVPTGEELLKTGSNQFDQARNMNVSVKPDFATNTAQDIRDALKGYDPEQIKPILNVADRMESLAQSAPGLPPTAVEMNQVENLRKQLSGWRTSPDATVRSAAKTAQEVLTKNQMGLTAVDAVAGDVPLYARTIGEAVGNYGAGKRSMIVQGKAALADLNAATAGSGANFDNATRQALKQLARPINNTNTPVWKKLGFNDAEGAAIEKVARGGPIGNAARFLGKLAPTGIVPAAADVGMGTMLGIGSVGSAALPAAGYIAKKIGDLSTKRAVQALDSLVRSRSPLATQVAASLPPAIVNQLPKSSAAILATLAIQNRLKPIPAPSEAIGQPAAY